MDQLPHRNSLKKTTDGSDETQASRSERRSTGAGPSLPVELELLVNDRCNGACIMCAIWKQPGEREISPEEIRQILGDPFFQELSTVDLSGGEPTLRPDLALIGQSLVEALPALRRVRLSTNALEVETVWERLCALEAVLDRSAIDLTIVVSLDGLGEIHDRNRGVSGNFAAAVELIDRVRTQGMQLCVRCTLTPLNVYYADDLLMWLEERGIENYAFRLGVAAQCFYNHEYVGQFRFTDDQIFHLAGFFDKLASQPGQEPGRKFYYRGLADQLALGTPRSVGCAWQTTRRVTLDAQGQLAYCLLHSPSLGNALGQSAGEIFVQHRYIRDAIVRDHCDACTYDALEDLASPPKTQRVKRWVLGAGAKSWKSLSRRLEPLSLNKPNRPAARPGAAEWGNVLITGWYGTETTGDKAILGEILHTLRSYNPQVNLTITSIDRKVSCQTNKELGYADMQIVDLQDAHQPAVLGKMDAVIIGGGPLMESSKIENLWKLFSQANQQQIARVIYGCGVGPIHNSRTKRLIAEICSLATAGFFRDENSYRQALQFGLTADLAWACDPSLAYISRWREQTQPGRKNGKLVFTGLLREQTREFYQSGLSAQNAEFIAQLQAALQGIQKAFSESCVQLLPMHMYWKGNDDRIFYRKLLKNREEDSSRQLVREYLAIDRLLEKLYLSDITLAMRYHGHLFSMALGIPFLSINYTSQHGKVGSLIKELGYQTYSEEFASFDARRAVDKIVRLVENRETLSRLLLAKTQARLERLQAVYVEQFGVLP